jgi:O-antigen/teichoic acid export membrane protein
MFSHIQCRLAGLKKRFWSRLPSLFQDLSWAASGQALNVFVALASLKVWAVYLVPSELGLMGLIIGLSSILVGVAVSPLLQVALVSNVHHSRQGRAHEFRSVTSSILRTRVGFVAMLVVIIGVPIALYFDLHWTTPLVVAGLFLIDARRSYEEMLFASRRRQREVAMIAFGDASCRLMCVWLALVVGPATAYAAIVGNFIGAFLFLLLLRLLFPLEAFPGAFSVADELRLPMQHEILLQAKPLVPSAILTNLAEMGNRYIIGAMIGLGAAGLFIISYGLVKRPYGMLNHVIAMTITPVLSDALVSNNLDTIRRTRYLWMVFAGVPSVLGVVLFYVFEQPIVTVLLSKQYREAGDMLFGLALAIAICNVCNVLNGFLTTLGKTNAVLISNACGCFTTLALTVWLCSVMGVWGAIWALAAGYSLQVVLSTWMFYKNNGRFPLAI